MVPSTMYRNTEIPFEILQEIPLLRQSIHARRANIVVKFQDLYGFMVEGNVDDVNILNDVREKMREQGKVWWDLEASKGANWYLQTYSSSVAFKSSLRFSLLVNGITLKKIIRKGIPPNLRPKVWFSLSGAAKKKSTVPDSYYNDLTIAVSDKITPATKQIDHDLSRTFPGHPWLDTPQGHAAVRRVLVGYSFRDSDVGYCQDLNYVAALLLLVMKTEEEAFWMLAVLLENVLVNDCYTDNLSGCHVEQRVFKDLLTKKCPRLSAHLEAMGFDVSLVTTEWFLCLFCKSLPSEAGLACNSMKSLIGIYDLNDKMDRVLSSVTSRAGGFVGSCSVPGLPERIIGLDRHLAESKRMLLKDETRVLLVSAPGGSGKTTLAKKLCHDVEIKDTFGDNILYVTVSRTSSLKIIAQKLFEHYGKSDCEFQTDEDAKNQIENLIRCMGSDQKLLLVLDDVWSETEFLVHDLEFQIKGFKILVTSRFIFPRYNSTYELSMLNDEDARTLFCYSAFHNDKIPNTVSADLVNKITNFCKGLPLALTVVGASLCGQPMLKWRITLKKLADGESILKSNSSLLLSLQISIDALEELPILRDCFFDLGSFPEDDRISGTALMDMWVELYNLDDEGMYASEYLLGLAMRNLVTLTPIRKDASEIEGYCSEHYVTQHDLLRELAILMSSQKPAAHRERLFMEIHSNEFPIWWTQQTEQPICIDTRILSISTDESFSSTWHDLDAPNVEVLILNIRSKRYTLPEFIKRMSKLKVLIVTGYGVYPTQLDNLSFLGSLSNLKRIRFEHISVSHSIQVIFALQNLKKLAFITCKIGNALQIGGVTESGYMLPNFMELEIDGCYDLKELPAELCRVLACLQKLTITNCHELDALPRELGTLSNLQTLRLHGCTKLQELPAIVGSMCSLGFFDISDCLSINALPEQIGELSGLRVINTSGCLGLKELPVTVRKLSQLEDVICDDETSFLWKNYGSELVNVKINLVEEDRSRSFMKICR